MRILISRAPIPYLPNNTYVEVKFPIISLRLRGDTFYLAPQSRTFLLVGVDPQSYLRLCSSRWKLEEALLDTVRPVKCWSGHHSFLAQLKKRASVIILSRNHTGIADDVC